MENLDLYENDPYPYSASITALAPRVYVLLEHCESCFDARPYAEYFREVFSEWMEKSGLPAIETLAIHSRLYRTFPEDKAKEYEKRITRTLEQMCIELLHGLTSDRELSLMDQKSLENSNLDQVRLLAARISSASGWNDCAKISVEKLVYVAELFRQLCCDTRYIERESRIKCWRKAYSIAKVVVHLRNKEEQKASPTFLKLQYPIVASCMRKLWRLLRYLGLIFHVLLRLGGGKGKP